jgi:hypothetical protein
MKTVDRIILTRRTSYISSIMTGKPNQEGSLRYLHVESVRDGDNEFESGKGVAADVPRER